MLIPVAAYAAMLSLWMLPATERRVALPCCAASACAALTSASGNLSSWMMSEQAASIASTCARLSASSVTVFSGAAVRRRATMSAQSSGLDGSGGEFARVRDAFARAGNGGLWIDGAGAGKHVGEVLRDAAAPFQHELRHFPALMHLRGAALRLQDEAARLGVRTVGEVDVRRQAEFA